MSVVESTECFLIKNLGAPVHNPQHNAFLAVIQFDVFS